MEMSDSLDMLVMETINLNLAVNRCRTEEKLIGVNEHKAARIPPEDRIEPLIRVAPSMKHRLVIDKAFLDICRFFNQRQGDFVMPRFVDRVLPEKIYRPTKPDSVVIPFSGGKVSLALAIRYKNMGKDVHLYYVHNTLSRYGKEDNFDNVIKLAKMLDVELEVKHLNVAYFEFSQMKHMVILSLALRYAVENGFSSQIIYGTFETAHISDNEPKNYGACIELISLYKKVMQKFCFGSDIIMPFPTYSIVWDELINSKRFIPYVNCISYIDRRVWYIARVDHNLIDEEDTKLYMKYIRELKKKLKDETGNIYNLWNKYFFYRIEKSKHYGELMKLPK